jgi:hypothetical protein
MRASSPANPPINSYEEKYFIENKFTIKIISCEETPVLTGAPARIERDVRGGSRAEVNSFHCDGTQRGHKRFINHHR